jgi:hypothetical protein
MLTKCARVCCNPVLRHMQCCSCKHNAVVTVMKLSKVTCCLQSLLIPASNPSSCCNSPSPGRTAQLVAKYRPPMPILTLVVPRLVNDGIRWRLEGKCVLL